MSFRCITKHWIEYSELEWNTLDSIVFHSNSIMSSQWKEGIIQ